MTKIEDMTLDELSQVLMECQKALAELKESKKEGKWKPAKGEEYWYRNNVGCIESTTYMCTVDEYRAKNIPIFPTEEAGKRYWHFMDTVKEKSYEFSKEEWDNAHIDKFELNYDGNIGQFRVMCMQNFKVIGGIHFKTKESAQYIIDNFKEELMEYWL